MVLGHIYRYPGITSYSIHYTTLYDFLHRDIDRVHKSALQMKDQSRCRIRPGGNEQGVAAILVGVSYETRHQGLVAEYLHQRHGRERRIPAVTEQLDNSYNFV